MFVLRNGEWSSLSPTQPCLVHRRDCRGNDATVRRLCYAKFVTCLPVFTTLFLRACRLRDLAHGASTTLLSKLDTKGCSTLVVARVELRDTYLVARNKLQSVQEPDGRSVAKPAQPAMLALPMQLCLCCLSCTAGWTSSELTTCCELQLLGPDHVLSERCMMCSIMWLTYTCCLAT